MNDYSNYFDDTLNNKLKNDGEYFLQQQLSEYGIDGIIDNVSVRFIVQTSGNVLNELKEERKIITEMQADIVEGSLVEFNNEQYLVVSEIDEVLEVYKRAKMIKINDILKIIIDGLEEEIPVIRSDKSNNFVVDGEDELKQLVLPYGMIGARMQNNIITSKIDYNINNRFIINEMAWKVNNIDKSRQEGIIIITLEKDLINLDDDNLSNEIANYNTKIPVINVLTGYVETIGVGEEIYLEIQIIENNKIIEAPTYSIVSDNANVNIENNKITGVAVGSSILTISYGVTEVTVNINIQATPNNEIELIINGSSQIKFGEQIEYQCNPTQNGANISNEDDLWYITNNLSQSTDLAIIVDTDTNKCTIQGNLNFESDVFYLWYQHNTLNKIYKEIQVIGR